jgi:hypothetical protein
MEPTLLVALSNAVAEMPAVIEALSKDPAVLSLTVTAVLLLIKSIETLIQLIAYLRLESKHMCRNLVLYHPTWTLLRKHRCLLTIRAFQWI